MITNLFIPFVLINFLISSMNVTVWAYDKTQASDWAKSCAYGCDECPDDSTCTCTYFTTHALKHGSWGYGLEGLCANLWYGVKSNKYVGWTKTGTSDSDVRAGDVVIMNNGHSGDASHCCIGTGKGLVSCHNPGKKDVPPSSTWYSGGYINGVYTYSGTSSSINDLSNTTSSSTQTSTETIISCSPYEADACNCVYYARDLQPKLPSGLTTCDDKKSKINSNKPQPGCVMFRTGDPTYCHATYVTKVTSSNVYYDQANWTPCKCSSDYLSISSNSILGYWCP